MSGTAGAEGGQMANDAWRGSAPPLVLVVEDDPRSAKVLLDVLPLHGYRVAHAASGEAALAVCAEAQPTLVLLDIQLPGMDGGETLARLRKLPGLDTVPVIATTASARLRDPASFMALGFADFEPKPIDLAALISKIDRLLRAGG